MPEESARLKKRCCSSAEVRRVGKVTRAKMKRIGRRVHTLGKSLASVVAFKGSILVIVLRGATVDAEASANHRLSVQPVGSPGDADAWIPVAIIRLEESGVVRAVGGFGDDGSICGIGTKTTT